MFRWIIDDTRALLRDLDRWRRRLTTRWQWMRLKSRQRLDEAAGQLENVRRGAETATRMCRECRALIPVKARVCPECGERPGRPVSTGLMRVLENMVPSFGSVSSVILTTNVAIYALTLFAWTRIADSLPPGMRVDPWALTLVAVGANAPALVSEGEIWRLLTAVFLHGGTIHLLFNCWAMLAVGPMIEELYGSRKFLYVYVTCGICASLASFVWRLGSWGPGVGASGALFGLIGLAAVWGWRRGGSVGEGVRAQMVQWAVYVFIFGFLLGADNAAHLGGLVTGALLGLAVEEGEPAPGAAARVWDVAAWISGLLVVLSLMMSGLRYGPTLQLVY